MRIPDSEVRTRLENVLALMAGWDAAGETAHEQEIRIQAAAREGLEMLGAYLRGDRLPEASFTSDRMRQRRSEMTWRIIDEDESPVDPESTSSP
ncbi:hypothetical protein ACW4TU_40745 [Streptomyces sp. QTS52]